MTAIMNLRCASAAIGIALLAACSGTGSPLAPSSSLPTVAGASLPTHPNQHFSPALATATQTSGVLFVAEADNNAVVMYPESGPATQPIGSITNGLQTPVAVAVDRAGNLFVANLSASTVVKFAAPYTGAPIATYQTGSNSPTALTVGPDGTLFVAAGPSVIEFPPNSVKPSLSLKVAVPVGMIADAHGDVFVADGSINDVEEFAPQSANGTRLRLSGIQSIGGISFDGSHNLLVADQGVLDPSHGGAVDVFAPGATKASRTLAFSKYTTAAVVLGSAGDRILVANSLTQGYNKLSVFDVNYPSGTRSQIVPVLVRGAGGIAVSPRAAF